MKGALLFVALLCCFSSYSQPVFPDSSFAKNGILQFSPAPIKPGHDERGMICFNLNDGKKLFIVGSGDPAFRFIVNKRNRDGSIDSSYAYFGYSEYFQGAPTAALLQPDGKLVISVYTNYPDFQNRVIRLEPNGYPDPTFGTNGVAPVPHLVNNYSIAVQSTGHIIVGGTSNYLNFAAVRLTGSGVPDDSFGNNGLISETHDGYGKLVNVVVTGNDRVVVAAVKSEDGWGFNLRLFSYYANGQPDPEFNGTGRLLDTADIWETMSATAAEDGKILVSVKPVSHTAPNAKIIRYNRNGTLDSSFNGTGYIIFPISNQDEYMANHDVALLPNGKIMTIGNYRFWPDFGVYFTRWNTDGTRDMSFGNNGEFRYPFIWGPIRAGNAGVDTAGNIAFSLSYHNHDMSVNNSEAKGISVLANGTIDNAFHQDGEVQLEIPFGSLFIQSLHLLEDERVLYDAGFSTTTDVPAKIGRLKANGDYDFGFRVTPEPSVPTRLVYKNGKVYAMTNYVEGLVVRRAISRLKENGAADPQFGQNGQIVQLQEDGINLFTVDNRNYIYDLRPHYINNSTQLQLQLYKPDGTREWQFGNGGVVTLAPEQWNFALAIETDPSGKIIVAGSSYSEDPYPTRFVTWICRLFPDGTRDSSFGNAGMLRFEGQMPNQSDLRKIKILPRGDMLVSSDSYTGYLMPRTGWLTKIKSNGIVDSSFGVNGVLRIGSAAFITLKNSHFYVFGTSYNGRNDGDFLITGYLPNGQINTEFGNEGRKVIPVLPGITEIDDAHLSKQHLVVSTSRQKTNQSGALIKMKFLDYSEYCPLDTMVYTSGNYCANIVNGIDPTIGSTNFAGIAYRLSGATNRSGKGTASGGIFNTGETRVKYYLESDSTVQCSFFVTVKDTTRPVISNLHVNRNILWPADHSYQDVTVNYNTSDNCGVSQVLLQVQSNEPVSSGDTGDVAPDWEILDAHHVRLRAENLLNGNGRKYTISILVEDTWGNSKQDTISVTVPKILDAPPSNLNVLVSPNPSQGNFKITLKSDDAQTPIDLKLVTDQGFFVVESKNRRSGESIIYGASLRKGLYFLEARQGKTVKVVPLLKL